MAHEFADLHDRAGRMKAKGVIRDVVTWKRSRSYFYWRAKRRIAEDGLVRQFQVGGGLVTRVTRDMTGPHQRHHRPQTFSVEPRS